MGKAVLNGDIFETGCDLVDVTSRNRPDPTWRFTDANGHEHRWFANGQPSDVYQPAAKYDVPSLVWVIDETLVDEDGEEYTVGHHECRQCGEHVKPRSKSDDTRQYVPGLRWFTINGEDVSEEEFRRRVNDARP